jgi:hypothetical protein
MNIRDQWKRHADELHDMYAGWERGRVREQAKSDALKLAVEICEHRDAWNGGPCYEIDLDEMLADLADALRRAGLME